MSNALYLDCHAGIAGDMLLSALVDIGANPQEIENELKITHRYVFITF